MTLKERKMLSSGPQLANNSCVGKRSGPPARVARSCSREVTLSGTASLPRVREEGCDFPQTNGRGIILCANRLLFCLSINRPFHRRPVGYAGDQGC